jgi:hypothetical protein
VSLVEQRRTEVVYIAAAPRSGTTIVSSLLGEVPGIFNAGEVRFLWKQIVEAGTCGCGEHLDRCEVWSKALSATAGPALNGVARDLVKGGAAHSLIRTLPFGLARRRVLGRLARPVRLHLDRTLPVYGAVATARDSQLVVDSSKSPSYAYLLAGSSELTFHLLHVVRDPRAVVYSWVRERGSAAPRGLRLRAVVYHALKWTAWNLWIEGLVRRRSATYRRVGYEEFAEAPYTHLSRIVAAHGLEVDDHMPIAGPDAHLAHLNPNHTVDGNGYRFRVGNVPIRPDDEWRQHMHRRERLIVELLTWPLLGRYGFRRRTRRGGAWQNA